MATHGTPATGGSITLEASTGTPAGAARATGGAAVGADPWAAPLPADTSGLDARLLPVAAAVWVGAWLGTGDGVSALGWATCATVAIAAAAAAWRRSPWLLVAMACALAAGAGIGWLRHEAVAGSQVAGWAADHAAATVEAQLVDDPDWTPAAGTRPARTMLHVRLVEVTARGERVASSDTMTVFASGGTASSARTLAAGSRLWLGGLLQPRDPGSPDAGSLRLRSPPRVLSPPGWRDRMVNRVRAGLRDTMRWSPADQQQLVPSFVVGDRTDVPDTMTAQFKATGLTHLMAVSGTNLALALAFVLAICRALGTPRIVLRTVALLTVAGFVVVCRGEPSVVRAAAMGLVALAASGTTLSGRRGVRHLGMAIIALLLFDPWLARTIGFQLSVAATAGIIWWGTPWQQALHGRCPAWVAESVAVPLAAQLATQPVVTAISGGVSVVGLLANALAAPFVGPVTVIGLAAMAVQQVPGPFGGVLGWLAGWCCWPVLQIAARLSALPGAVLPWSNRPTSLVVLGLLCWLLARAMPRLFAWRWGWVLAACLALVLPFWRPGQLGWPGDWQVVFCDVGQGDSTVVRAGPHEAVVIDVGPQTSAARDCLRQLGVTRVPLVLLTHFHADHTGGLEAVEGGVSVGQVVLNPLRSPAADVARVERVLAQHRTPSRTAVVGEHYTVGGAQIDLVGGGPMPGAEAGSGEGESPAENDSSLALGVHVGGFSVLVAGDAEPEEQQYLLDRGADVRATVLKMPHHGSARQLPAFWQQTGAVDAVASAGLHNDYGHPAPAALRLASQCGMRVQRTDQQGSIAMWLADGRLQVRTQKQVT